MSIKSNSAPSWIGRGKLAGSGGPVEISLDKELTPYIVLITKEGEDPVDDDNHSVIGIYGGSIKQKDWGVDQNTGKFECSIEFTEHQKGYIWRPVSELEFPVNGEVLSENAPTNLIIPRVKTYSQVSGNSYEETYDSAKINIKDGTVTVYSDTDTPYLVLIY